MWWNYRQNSNLPCMIIKQSRWPPGRRDTLDRTTGRGLPSQIPPFRYFLNFSTSPKHTFAIDYYVDIWQVSPQLGCSDPSKYKMWSKESSGYFFKMEIFAYGEINERGFSNPTPGPGTVWCSECRFLRPRFGEMWHSCQILTLDFPLKYFTSGNVTRFSQRFILGFV